MKSNCIIFYSLILFFLFMDSLSAQIINTYDFNRMNGTQIYFIESSTAFYYVSLINGINSTSGDRTVIIDAYLYLNSSNLEVQYTKGVYIGIGFGKNTMAGSEMMIMQYKPGTTELFNCLDAYSTDHGIKYDKDNGGNNDAYFLSGSLSQPGMGNNFYKTVINWKCVKNIEKLDITFDWVDFQNWQTLKAPVIGAWGYNADNGLPKRHFEHSITYLRMIDGNGVPSYPTMSSSFLYNNLIKLLLLLSFVI